MKSTIAFFVALLFSMSLYASWQLPVTNFVQKEYNAGTQNWQIVQQDNGWLYFANNYGLLQFDGKNWSTQGIWNSTVLRSLEVAPDGAIYAGGSNEFGRFTSNAMGGLDYEPLSLNLPEQYKNFGEVWNIHVMDSNIYVQTRNYLFKLLPSGVIEVIEPKSRIFSSAKVGNALYLAMDDGVYLLFDDQFNALRGSELLDGYEVRSILPFGHNQMIIATDFGGLFLYDGASIKSFKTDADAFIKENQLYSMAISADNLAFGTVLKGLAITDVDGKNVRYINNSNGLQNNTVLSLLFDDNSNLWLGLDNGIDYVQLNTPISNLYGPTNFYGSGYASLVDGKIIYLGTNQGLFKSDFPFNNDGRLTDLQRISGSQGQVWNIVNLGNTVLCCHNRGLFEVINNRLEPVYGTDGVWDVQMLAGDTGYAVAGTYNGFLLLRKQGRQWRVEAKLDDFAHTARVFQVADNDQIWVITPRGVERLSIDMVHKKLRSDLIIKHSGDPQEIFGMHRLGKDIAITTPYAIYTVGASGQLVQNQMLERLLDGARHYGAVTLDPNNNIWYMEDNALKTHRYDAKSKSYVPDSELIWDIPYFNVGGFEHINAMDPNHVIVGNVNGYALANYKEDKTPYPLRNVYIRKMVSTKNDSLIAGQSFDSPKSELSIDYVHNSLRFEFASSYHTMSDDLYSYRLEPMEKEWSSWSTSTQKEYTALPEGKYTFCVRMKDSNQQVTDTNLSFSISPPWYRTWWVYFFELTVLLFILYLTLQSILTRIARKQHLLEEQKDAELAKQQELYKEEASEREREIISLKNERLELELKSKSQELANVLLNHINKNEVLSDIKLDLKKLSQDITDKDVESAKRKIMLLQNKISRNIEQNIDWNKFEENFDIVNDQFVKKLMERYPWMSKNERKLCIYIKMGLLTKEIAPLMDMSVRGVEMLRYRMRKKMDLERTNDLQGFFQLLSNDATPIEN